MDWDRIEGIWTVQRPGQRLEVGQAHRDDLTAINGRRDKLESKSATAMPKIRSDKRSTIGSTRSERSKGLSTSSVHRLVVSKSKPVSSSSLH